MLHVNLSVVVCVETSFSQRPNNRSTPNNRYGPPTLDGNSEALLQWQFDQHLPPRLIRTFTGGHDSVETIFYHRDHRGTQRKSSTQTLCPSVFSVV